MNSILRRARGIISATVLWAFIWYIAGAIVGFIEYLRGHLIDEFPTTFSIVVVTVAQYGLGWSLLGAFSGAFFAAALALGERHRSVGALTFRRMTLWGILGSVLMLGVLLLYVELTMPLGRLSVDVVPVITIVVLGACSGVGMLWIARRSSVEN